MQKIDSISDTRILPALGLATLLILYFIKAAQVSGMSIGFAVSVSDGGFGFHPHHLLYQSVLKLFYGILGSAHCDAICAGQFHSIIWGVVSVLSTYVISRYAMPSKLGAIVTAISLMAIHGFAVYATQLEPYIPILGMSSLLAAILVARGPRNLGWAHEFLFVSVMSLSLLFHQAMLFFFVPLAYWLIANNGRDGLMSVIRMIAITGVIVLSTYIAVFRSVHPDRDFIDFYHWMMYYQVISDASHGTFQDLLGQRLRVTVRSVQKLFVALHEPQMRDVVILARIFVSIYIPILILWNALQIFRKNDAKKIRTLMFIWAGVFGLFFFWWQASVYKFFIPTLVPIVVLTSLSINDIVQRWHHNFLARNLIPGIAIAGVVFIAGFNLTASILPLSRSPGAIYDLAEKFAKAAPAECNLYSMRYLSGYVSYYFDRKTPRPFNLMFRKHFYSTRDTAVADTIAVDNTFDDERCAVIPFYWISREYFQNRTKQAIGRYLSPDDWSEFIAWFFEVEEDTNSAEISFKSYDIVEDADGDRYLRIDRTTRRSTVNIDELLKRLDTLYMSRPGGSFAPNQPEIGRRRHLAFGYN